MNKKKTNYTGKVLEYTLKTKIMAERNKLTATMDSGEKKLKFKNLKIIKLARTLKS